MIKIICDCCQGDVESLTVERRIEVKFPHIGEHLQLSLEVEQCETEGPNICDACIGSKLAAEFVFERLEAAPVIVSVQSAFDKDRMRLVDDINAAIITAMQGEQTDSEALHSIIALVDSPMYRACVVDANEQCKPVDLPIAPVETYDDDIPF